MTQSIYFFLGWGTTLAVCILPVAQGGLAMDAHLRVPTAQVQYISEQAQGTSNITTRSSASSSSVTTATIRLSIMARPFGYSSNSRWQRRLHNLLTPHAIEDFENFLEDEDYDDDIDYDNLAHGNYYQDIIDDADAYEQDTVGDYDENFSTEQDDDEYEVLEWYEDDDCCYPANDFSFYENDQCDIEDADDAADWDMILEEGENVSEEYFSEKDQPDFLLPRTIPAGQVVPIRWRDSNTIIQDEEIFAVGLPPELLSEFRRYFDEVGMLNVVQQLLYSNVTNSQQPEGHMKKKVTLDDTNTIQTLKDGQHWNSRRADHWPTDMVWFDPADDACYERLLDVLKIGNFETVMEGLRKHLNQPDLVIHGNGAIFNSHFDPTPGMEYAQLHRDNPETRGAFYNILIPVYLPEGDDHEASLHIASEEDGWVGEINLRYNIATVIGSDSWHGTGECDYRDSKGFRFSISIWVSEMTERNVEVIATDPTSPWPLRNDTEWYWAQAGRRLIDDSGRGPFEFQDKRLDCDKVQKQCHLWKVRSDCARTCGLYMDV